MKWNDDARAALAKAPLFVRGMITKRVEEHARAQGMETVTLECVNQLRASFSKTDTIQNKQADPAQISTIQIEQMIRNNSPQPFADERTYEVRVCGLTRCPRSIIDVVDIAKKMVKVIEDTNVPEAVLKRVEGPILRHHRLMVSISGCTNSCSQPQIADFGVQGRVRPAIGLGDCIDCGGCVSICREDAVTVTSSKPELHPERCVNCGDCASACPTQALINAEIGYSALIGGKLGRRPQLAQTLFDFTDENMLLSSLHVMCEIFTGEMGAHERVADAVNRIGVPEIARRCHAKRKLLFCP